MYYLLLTVNHIRYLYTTWILNSYHSILITYFSILLRYLVFFIDSKIFIFIYLTYFNKITRHSSCSFYYMLLSIFCVFNEILLIICFLFFTGYKVSDTVRKGILDVSHYNNTEKELMLGSLSALGQYIWDFSHTFCFAFFRILNYFWEMTSRLFF